MPLATMSQPSDFAGNFAGVGWGRVRKQGEHVQGPWEEVAVRADGGWQDPTGRPVMGQVGPRAAGAGLGLETCTRGSILPPGSLLARSSLAHGRICRSF